MFRCYSLARDTTEYRQTAAAASKRRATNKYVNVANKKEPTIHFLEKLAGRPLCDHYAVTTLLSHLILNTRGFSFIFEIFVSSE